MSQYILKMTEVFDELEVVGYSLKEEDQVVYLVASLPESFNILITVLEANAHYPNMEVVRERKLKGAGRR